MDEDKKPNKKLIHSWIKAGMRHVADAGTIGSLVQHATLPDSSLQTVSMIIVLPKYAAEPFRKEIEVLMEAMAKALAESGALQVMNEEDEEDEEDKAPPIH